MSAPSIHNGGFDFARVHEVRPDPADVYAGVELREAPATPASPENRLGQLDFYDSFLPRENLAAAQPLALQNWARGELSRGDFGGLAPTLSTLHILDELCSGKTSWQMLAHERRIDRNLASLYERYCLNTGNPDLAVSARSVRVGPLYSVYTLEVAPRNPDALKGTVVLSTGYQVSHAMYLRDVILPLVNNGFRIVAYDHLSHGYSDAVPHVLAGQEKAMSGYFPHFGMIDMALRAVVFDSVFRYDQPVFLMGHSMGGLSAARLAASAIYEKYVKGMVYVSPACALVKKVPAAQVALSRMYTLGRSAALNPKRKIDSLYAAIYPDIYPHMAALSERGHGWSYLEILQAAKELCAGVDGQRTGIPALLVHAQDDSTTPNEKSEEVLGRMHGNSLRFSRIVMGGHHPFHSRGVRSVMLEDMLEFFGR